MTELSPLPETAKGILASGPPPGAEAGGSLSSAPAFSEAQPRTQAAELQHEDEMSALQPADGQSWEKVVGQAAAFQQPVQEEHVPAAAEVQESVAALGVEEAPSTAEHLSAGELSRKEWRVLHLERVEC